MTAQFDPRNPTAYDWENGPTPPLDRVRAALTHDPGFWYRIPSAPRHHHNLFTEATHRLDAAEPIVKHIRELTDGLNMTAYRPERGRDTNIETRRITTRLRRILDRKPPR